MRRTARSAGWWRTTRPTTPTRSSRCRRESARPAGMSDIEWQIRNWYNFTWLCGDSLVEQAVHNADKIMWVMNDSRRSSCVARRRPRRSRQRRQHLRPLRGQLPVPERLPRVPRQPAVDRLLQRHARLHHGHRGHAAPRQRASRASRPDGKIKWQFAGRGVRHVPEGARRAVRVDPRRQAEERRSQPGDQHAAGDHGPHAAYSGQQVTWEQALNSQVSLVPEPVDWNGEARGARPGDSGRSHDGLLMHG